MPSETASSTHDCPPSTLWARVLCELAAIASGRQITNASSFFCRTRPMSLRPKTFLNLGQEPTHVMCQFDSRGMPLRATQNGRINRIVSARCYRGLWQIADSCGIRPRCRFCLGYSKYQESPGNGIHATHPLVARFLRARLTPCKKAEAFAHF